MTGNELIKQKRVEKNFSVRFFASITEITPRMISYYESGEKLLEHMPVYKCQAMFDLLELDITSFFQTYFPYEKDLQSKILKWEQLHPYESDFFVLKKRIYARLMKIKSRGKLSGESTQDLFDVYCAFFDSQSSKYALNPILTREEYNQYVLPILYHVRLTCNEMPENSISHTILDALYRTDYTVTDLCTLCDITTQPFNDYLNGKRDFGLIHIDTALKICYILNLDFDSTFSSCKKNN